MNFEASSATSSPSGSGIPANQRKERGAIAAQACETCRSRKQRCDEQRPKCGTCQKFKLDCRYREPQPTKKDKTLVEILDRLRIIEGKVDHLGSRHGTESAGYEPSPGLRRPPNLPTESSGDSVPTTSSTQQSGPVSPLHLSLYSYTSAVHKVMAWPMVRQILEQTQPNIPDLHAVILDHDPPSGMIEQQARRRKLPVEGVEAMTMDERASLGLRLDAPTTPGGLRMAEIDWQNMETLAKAYFDTFNLMYPIMDRQSFMNQVLPSVVSDRFDESVASTLVCLVLALGSVAVADTQSIPVMGYKGRPTGVKGGTLDRPPGLPFFNEARKRLGFNMSDCSLENVQVHALAGLYFESCSRHLEFWRMTISASMACHALLTSNPRELESPRADLIRRIFWHCSIMETCLNLELELPLTGLEKLEDMVGLPDFSGPFCEADYLGNQESRFQEHFASQIVLRRLSVGFHNTMSNAIGPTTTPTPFSPPESSTTPDSSVLGTVKHLASQLDEWRGMLPVNLRWNDAQATVFAAPVPDIFSQDMYAPQPLQQMFTADLTHPSAPYPYATDVQVALLRTRYYYTKYLIYRPFIYKALHHANLVGQEDAKAIAECLKACIKWPIIMSPTCYRKRLIPYLFFWTQNLLGVLIMLHLSRQVPILSTIRTRFCESNFELDAQETVSLSINWIRDLKDVDPTAEWCWNILGGLYHLDELGAS